MLIGVVLLAAVVISVGMIYAVKNINVTLITYAENYDGDYEGAKSSLSVFEGESILFISEEQIVKVVKDSNYTLASFEKIYPCTINVTLRERIETFAIPVEGGYAFYDSDGILLRKSTENINNGDNYPNVEVVGVTSEKIEYIASVAATFKDKFKSLRSIVTSINLDSKPEIEGYTDKLIFNLRCGLKIRLDNYAESTEEKIEAAYAKFCTLTDRQKLSGVVRSYRFGGEEGIINADYSAI